MRVEGAGEVVGVDGGVAVGLFSERRRLSCERNSSFVQAAGADAGRVPPSASPGQPPRATLGRRPRGNADRDVSPEVGQPRGSMA